MINKKHIKTVLFVLLGTQMCLSQAKTCTSSNSEYQDLNTLGKCAIEKFKTSKKKEFIQVSSRNRFVKRKDNVHLNKLKAHLKTVPDKKEVFVEEKPVVTTSSVNDKEVQSFTSNTKDSNKELIIKDYLRFDQVTKAPIFITCDDTNSKELKEQCNKETIVGVLLDNLVYPFDAAAEGVEGKVWVRFIIDKEGYVKNITTKGPKNGVLLEKEAERLIKLLPKFIPGKFNNDYVSVEYFMPIDFQLDD